MNGGGPVVLAIEWPDLQVDEDGRTFNNGWTRFSVDGLCVGNGEFEAVLRLLAIPQGPAL
jgi:hypothetical protein